MRIVVPLVTPFDERSRVNRAAIEGLVDYCLAEGADALMPTALTSRHS